MFSEAVDTKLGFSVQLNRMDIAIIQCKSITVSVIGIGDKFLVHHLAPVQQAAHQDTLPGKIPSEADTKFNFPVQTQLEWIGSKMMILFRRALLSLSQVFEAFTKGNDVVWGILLFSRI